MGSMEQTFMVLKQPLIFMSDIYVYGKSVNIYEQNRWICYKLCGSWEMMTEGFYHPELWTLRLRLMGGTRWSRHKRAHDSLPMRSLAVHFAIITWIIRRRPAAQRDLSFWRLLQSRTWLSLPSSKRACLLGKEAGTVWPPRVAQLQKLFTAAVLNPTQTQAHDHWASVIVKINQQSPCQEHLFLGIWSSRMMDIMSLSLCKYKVVLRALLRDPIRSPSVH